MKSHIPIVIVGAGIAGLACAYELLKKGKAVTIIDAQDESQIGGLAKESFGGMALMGTPLQKLNRIEDNSQIAWQDWSSFAGFSAQDKWPMLWAKHYIERSKSDVYDWVNELGVRFLPAVNWVERGDYTPGNSVPRYHVIWGTGKRLIDKLVENINKLDGDLNIEFDTRVEAISANSSGFGLILKKNENLKNVTCEKLVIACGGINGNLNKVRENWDSKLSPAPKPLLNGSHPSADGHLHDEVQAMGGNITHLNWMWNYAAGIHKKNPEFPDKGLSLIPAKTALWLDAHGKRIGPEPMISCFDTHNLCHRIANLPHQYTWQIMNRKIAEKEIAVSGSDVNPSIRDRKFLTFMKEILFGNKRLIDYLINNSDDVLVADTLPELVQKMNQHTPDVEVSIDKIKESLIPYDRQLKAGPRFHNDDQLRRLLHLRNWPGDRLRTCQSQPILDTKAGPLIAIKASIISRKSMGGIQTNLSSQVLTPNGDVIEDLYAIGEAAGFGGGGISGNRSLEGTFLAGSILTARRASEDLSK